MSSDRPTDGLPEGLSGLFAKAQRIQEQMADMQERMAQKTVVGESGGGMVRVTANGRQQVVRIDIDREAIDPDEPEMLQDLIVAAVNQALAAAQRLMAEEMRQATGGLNIPGLF